MILRLTPDEFIDFAMILMYDKLSNKEIILPFNARFNELAKDIKGKGVKSTLFKYYLSTDPFLKEKYRRVKDMFTIEDFNQKLEIEIEKD